MSLLSPVARKASPTVRGIVKIDVSEADPIVITQATHETDIADIQAEVDAATVTANSAASDASAAQEAAEAAVAAADGFPVADFLGTLTALGQDPGAAASNSGKWWTSAVAGTLSHGNAGGAVVEDGGRILSNGTAWQVYAASPTYVPDGSLVKGKLAASVRTSLTIADATADAWMEQATVAEGVATPLVGDAEGTEDTTRIAGEAISATGTITSVTWYAAVTGTHEIRVYSKSGSVFTLRDSASFTVTSTGLQTQADVALDVQAGWYVGFYSAAGRITQDNGVSGKSIWTYAGNASTSATFTNFASIQLQLGWSLLTATPQLPAEIEIPRGQLDTTTEATLDDSDFLIDQLIDEADTQEGEIVPEYETETSTNTTRLYGSAATTTGTINEFRIYANGAGSMDLRVYSKVGSVFTLEESETKTVTEGINTFTGLSIPITAGQYVGVYANTAGLGQVNDGTGDGVWTYGGNANPSATFTEFTTVRPQIGWTTSGRVIKFPEFSDILLAPYIEVIQTATSVRVFVPNASRRYTEYVINRETAAGTRKDVWRIVSVYIADRNQRYDYSRTLFSGASIVDGGAWEFAVKISTDADFVGTWHGYEELSAAYHIVDGMRIANGAANHKCREWEIVQRSAVYRYGTSTVVAYRTMRLSFTAEGVRCRQQVEWQSAATLTNCYYSMMPIERIVGSDQITDSGFVAPRCELQDVSAEGFALVVRGDGDFIRIWGDDSEVSARVDQVEWATATHNAWISNSTLYNKLYFDHAPSAAVTATTVHKSEWTAAIECANAASEADYNPVGHTHTAFSNIDVDSIRLTTGSQYVKLEGAVLEGQPTITPTLE